MLVSSAGLAPFPCRSALLQMASTVGLLQAKANAHEVKAFIGPLLTGLRLSSEPVASIFQPLAHLLGDRDLPTKDLGSVTHDMMVTAFLDVMNNIMNQPLDGDCAAMAARIHGIAEAILDRPSALPPEVTMISGGMSFAQREVRDRTAAKAHDVHGFLGVISALLEEYKPRIPKEAFHGIEDILKLADATTASMRRGLSGTLDEDRQAINLNHLPVIDERLIRAFANHQLGISDVDVQINKDDHVREVDADLVGLCEVVWNLIKNGLEAMRNSIPPKILSVILANNTLNHRDTESMTFVGPVPSAGEYVLMSIGDTGNGMSPEQIENLSKPYGTTKVDARGLQRGLGVYSASQEIRKMGGYLAVQSVPGEGTTFLIFFPSHVSKSSSTRSSLRPPSMSEEEGYLGTPQDCLLVVDDSAINVTIIKRQLPMNGYENIYFASTLAEATQVLRDNPQINCLIMDGDLPDGSGFDFVRDLRNAGNHMPVVFNTGHSFQSDLPGTTVVQKGVGHLKTILFALRRVIEGR